MLALLNRESVIKANSQFWEQMLDMRLEVMAFSSEFCVGPGHVVGSVALSGAWRGSIEVRMAGSLAYAATAAMLMQPVDRVAADDVLDAAKEIANMIAGVVKSSLPRPCSMTVPESAMVPEGCCGAGPTAHSIVVGFHHLAGDCIVQVQELAADS